MEGSLSILMVMILFPVGLLCSPQADNRQRQRQEASHSIQFPGHDAFDAISGLKNSSESAPSAERPFTTTYRPGGQGGLAQTVATTETYRPSPENELADCRDVYIWENVSPFDQERQTSSQADTRLSIESMFRIINKMESIILDKNSNLVFSPVGITSVLGQLMLAAQGNTLQQLETLLAPGKSSCHTGAANKFHYSFKSLVSQLWRRRGSASYELSLRNALFHQYPGRTLRREFTERLSSDYATEIFQTDFRRNPGSSLTQINSWASGASRGKISQLIPEVPPRSTSAIISSITYFKASWENLFNSQFTSPGPFYLDGNRNGRATTVNFMVAEFEVPYAESTVLGCRIMALPYTSNETVLYVVMPLGPPKRRRPLPLPLPLGTPSSTLPTTLPVSSNSEDDGTQLVSRVGEVEPEGVKGQGSYGNRISPQRTPSIFHRLQTFYTTDSVVYPGNPHAVMYAFIQSSLQRVRRQKRQLASCSDRSGSNAPCLEERSSGVREESPLSAANLHRLAARLGPSEFARLVSEMRLRKVSVILPKLSLTSNVKLRDALQALGVPSVFGEDADLTGAVERDGTTSNSERKEGGWWRVDEVLQKSRLDIDEYGTEAASGTAVSIVDYGGDSVVFKVNSPFLAVVRHEATGAPIFWASVVNPS